MTSNTNDKNNITKRQCCAMTKELVNAVTENIHVTYAYNLL